MDFINLYNIRRYKGYYIVYSVQLYRKIHIRDLVTEGF